MSYTGIVLEDFIMNATFMDQFFISWKNFNTYYNVFQGCMKFITHLVMLFNSVRPAIRLVSRLVSTKTDVLAVVRQDTN